MAKVRGIEDVAEIAGAIRRVGAEEQFIPTLRNYPAGVIELEANDAPNRIHRLLRKAADGIGINIDCSWSKDGTALYWAKSNKPKRTRKPRAKAEVVEVAA